MNLSSKQKLDILYEYYSRSDDLIEKAILFSYPMIYVGMREFIAELIER